MIVLRLVTVFMFSAVLTGCQASKLESFFPELPCNPPGKHSPQSCYYKLEITNVSGNQVTGKASQGAIDIDNTSVKLGCKTHSPHPNLCPTSGDKSEYSFIVDGDTSGLQNTEADFISDPNTDHLRKR